MRLKDLREDHDLKQSDVAKILNVSQVSYGRYELGTSEPTIDSLVKLADFYNVSLDYLVGRDLKGNSKIEEQTILETKASIRKLGRNELIILLEKQIDDLLNLVEKNKKSGD